MNTSRDLTKEFWTELACKLPPEPTILDLGSHRLEEAELLIPHLVQPNWHGFELNRECFRYARETIAKHLVEEYKCAITMTCAAVGREVGSATLHLSSKKNGEPWTPSSSIRKPTHALEAYPWMAFETQVRVPLTTLDRYCEEQDIHKADLIKMDIQGAEIDAIMGGQSILAHTTYLITEAVEYAEYEGQQGLNELAEALPGRWFMLERLASDALFINLANMTKYQACNCLGCLLPANLGDTMCTNHRTYWGVDGLRSGDGATK